MIGERRLLASLAAVTVVAVVIQLCRGRPPEPTPVEPKCPPPTVPVKVLPKPPAPTPSDPIAPTAPIPCAAMANGHDKLELVADGDSAVVCWRNGACVDDHLRDTTRPTPTPATEHAHLDGDRICTGARCDAVGTKLRAAARDGTIDATVDHRIVVVESDRETQLWNRAADRRIPLPRPAAAPGSDGDVTGVEILGTRVLVVRDWDPKIIPPDGSWPSRGTIVDATGAVTAHVFVARDDGPIVTDLGGDRFIVVNGSGGFTLVVNGTPTWFGDLAAWDASPAGDARGSDRAVWWGQHVPVTMVALRGEPVTDSNTIDGAPDGKVEVARVGYKWCDYDACHVGRLEIDIHTDRRGRETQSFVRSNEHELPACP